MFWRSIYLSRMDGKGEEKRKQKKFWTYAGARG